MLSEILKAIPPEVIKFLLVAIFSLLIGLEQRRHIANLAFESVFGTDRTFTLIGILGFVLYVISPQNFIPFLCGGAAIAIYLGIYYLEKIRLHQKFGFTSLVTALITYCLAPLIYTQHLWLVLLIVVVVLVITEIKETLFEFTQKFDHSEFITLAKFLIIAGVILPLLPDKPISPDITITPYKFWLGIVAVSGISYFSYLLKKFVFPDSGIILTGILGGLYSSTATTIILAKKSKENPSDNKEVPAIMLATTMMYLRILLLAFFFDKDIAIRLLPSFAIFIVGSALIAIYFLKFRKHIVVAPDNEKSVKAGSNPLEFKTALLFAVLFIFFAFATAFVKNHYGTKGINVLAFIVGVTDIDPFIINLFQSKWSAAADAMIVTAVLNAISSNNLLKMIYATVFCEKALRKQLIAAFSILIILGLVMAYI
ncbi:MAG TPA: DUF4010 domain-containing protein [Flavipsychrobacter sp.]|nr:DUF4010 domain-containing protein [Flavipsychrobacter sp.]